MNETKFNPGFRLSVFDALVLITGAGASIYFASEMWQISFVIGFAVAHFFFFCNVFRIQRKSELIWAACFIILTSATIMTGFPGWSLTAILSLSLSTYLIAKETRKPYYHGIAWQRLNPELPVWWQKESNQVKCNLTMDETHLKKIAADFSEADYHLVIAELESITLSHVSADSQINLDNTRFAILQLSKGDINKLRHYVAAAKTDFRDVIYWASTQDHC